MAFKAPDAFDFSTPTSWPSWRDRWERFRKASKLSKDSQEVQVSALIYSMGPEAEHLLTSFDLPESDARTYDVVIGKLNDYFLPRSNIIAERQLFETRNQREHESNELYIRTIMTQAEKCDFGATKSERVRDRLIAGMLDKQMSRKVQLQALDESVTMDKVIAMMRSSDLVGENHPLSVDRVTAPTSSSSGGGGGSSSGHFSGETPQRPRLQQQGQHREEHDQPPQRQYQRNQQRQQYWTQRRQPLHQPQQRLPQHQSCKYCGKARHPSRSQCPAFGSTCSFCNGLDHWECVCYRKRARISEVAYIPSAENVTEEYFLGEVRDANEEKWTVDLVVEGQDIVDAIRQKGITDKKSTAKSRNM